MATSRGTLFDPELVSDLITKVRGKSSIAALCAQTPIPFNGIKEFTFSMDNEIDIVAEEGKKTEGGFSLAPKTIVPIKFEYGARTSDEFLYATEEEQVDILTAFNDGFAKKVAKGLDLAAFHGINPRTGAASTVVGTNHFDGQVTQTVTYAEATPDDNLEDAIALIDGSEMDVTGMALSKTFGAAMAKVKAQGVKLYPEFAFGASPASLNGIAVDVNKTVSGGTTKDHAIIGDFQNAFKWGYSKQIPTEIIRYGDPDNSGKDLKGYNQIYIRAEIYLGWGILLPEAFAIIKEAGE
ncbi:phage major capsid protein [Faecalicatena contorta]|uniref:phage major capsid protein n=1 Tax=Faecalicatena contorta TaxID=39482 RepID=UPI001961D35B|nr:phage major capsid protein [Faecalicatena contorta]MBM6686797.1 phage major capsid protein [Faecalicatena contorta]MBM6709694.1 phage major capsid protein [Faecalicatena contorta]